MKNLEKYSKWVLALGFLIIAIAVYKTFDNFYKIAEWFSTLLSVLSPFVTGFVIAYILNIPCKKINKICNKSKFLFVRKKSKVISITSVYLIALLILFVIIRAVVPAIYRNIVDLYYNIPRYFDEAITFLDSLQAEYNINIFEVDKNNAMEVFNKLLNKFDISEFGKYAQGFVNVTSGVINAFIGIIISVYMLIDKEKIIVSVRRVFTILLKKERSEKLFQGIDRINGIFSKYVFCLLLDAVLMAIMATVVLSVLRVRYAIILGSIIGLCNLIPYFGAIIAAAASVIITLITGGIFKAIWTAVSLLVLQQIDGNLIGPKIMGEALDVSPLWIIFAVTVGGGFFGVAGMIVSVPVLVAIKMIVSDFINEREMEQKSE